MTSEVVKMAAVVVSAELKFRDGESHKIAVNTDNNMTSLISSIQEITRQVTLLLSTLVEREKASGVTEGGEEEGSDDGDDDDDDDDEEPPEKRVKT